MTEIFNKKSETKKRKELRRQMPKAEVLLWIQLKGKKMQGHKFRRQYGVGPYVLDFYCPELKLAIEIDGDSHFQAGAEEYDRDRQALIEKLGIRFLRFTNSDVYESLNGVLEKVAKAVQRIKKNAAESPVQSGDCGCHYDYPPKYAFLTSSLDNKFLAESERMILPVSIT